MHGANLVMDILVSDLLCVAFLLHTIVTHPLGSVLYDWHRLDDVVFAPNPDNST